MQDSKFPGRLALIAACAATALPIGALLLVAGPADSVAEPGADLPAWFDPAHRIGKNRGIIFAPKKAAAASVPRGMYTTEWLDEHFTHYIGHHNAFIWCKPKVKYPSDGKIMAGIKVIVGAKVGDLSLVCTIIDGQPESMYVQSALLRDRSAGPPAEAAED